MKRYSLANHILSIESNDPSIQSIFDTVSIGGEGSHIGSISINQNSSLWTTNGFATGAWTHDKNLDRTGTVVIVINQLSDDVAKFIRMCNMFYSGDYGGFTLTLTNNIGEKLATCIDSYIQGIPSQDFAANSGNQRWTFTCGKIAFGS